MSTLITKGTEIAGCTLVFSGDFDSYNFTSLRDATCTLKGVKDMIKERRGGGSIFLYFRGGHEIRYNDSLPGSLHSVKS